MRFDSCWREKKESRESFFAGRKGQISVFIIVGILIISLVVLFFIFRENLGFASVPAEFMPVYTYYVSCVEAQTKIGANLLGQQGGYIVPPEFVAGSVYMPFSSQLDFLGNGVPYWFYVSGNGLAKEQVPSKELMEGQLNEFLMQRLSECDFSGFVDQGFVIQVGKEVLVESTIKEKSIDLDVSQELVATLGNTSWASDRQHISVASNLGRLYALASKTFKDFRETHFLEEYGIDVLRLSAPVDGTEISCSPHIWSVGAIGENLTTNLEANTRFIKLAGDYYTLSKDENKYFVHDIGENVKGNVQFMYLREWPMKLQVWPSENGFLKAEPVGNQEGLGMLGFCYLPYHFVYDLAYPVMIQFFGEEELFQFPVVVYINKNQPLASTTGVSAINPVPELCLRKNTQLAVTTRTMHLEAVEADISYVCFASECPLGRSYLKDGKAVFIGDFPQCVNGSVVAQAEGYETARVIFSSVRPGELTLSLKKLYTLPVFVQQGGVALAEGEYALLTFTKAGVSTTVAYPEQNFVALSEGQYSVKAIIYSDAQIPLEASTREQCVQVLESGFFGLLGRTHEECFDINIPAQMVTVAVSGGGTSEYYMSESQLESASGITIDGASLGTPSKISDVQLNFNNAALAGLDISLN